MAYRLELLAGVRVLREDEPVESLAGHRQKLAFLAYLALQPGLRAPRERLLPIFWPDRDESTARHSLSQLVYELRREVADLLEATADTVRLVPSAFECDAVQFEKAAHAGDVTRAAALYRGELLEGFSLPGSAEFERWVEDRRGQFQRLHRKVAREHVAALRTQARLEGAIEAARRWLAADPFEDEAHHTLIELLFLAGQRAAALEQYERYVRLCKDELEVEPLEETRALVERMRSGEPGARPAPAEPTYPTSTPPPVTVRESAPAAERPTTLGQLIGELKRRYVFRVAVVYAIVAWLVVQVAKATFEDLYLPREAMTFVIVLAILGFPIAVVLAWAFEITPEGVRRTSPGAMARKPTATRSALLVLDAPPRSASELIQELFRRRVLFVLALYLGVAIVALRAIGSLEIRFALPGWIGYAVYGALAVGLPVVLALAWAGGRGLERSGIPAGAVVIPRERIPFGFRWLAALRPPELMGLLGLLAIGLVSVALAAKPGRPVTASGLDPSHVAVLYFDDESEGRELGHLAAGLTRDLIRELSEVQALTVRSRNAVKPFQETKVSLDSIARALNVGSVVGGTVARSGDEVRVYVELADGATGSVRESQMLTRPWGELFPLLDDLTQEVAGFLRKRLGMDIRLPERRAETNSAAWELVLRAERLIEDYTPLVRAGDTAAASRVLQQADSLLVQAEALDPKWVEPIVLRGWVAADQAALLSPIPGKHDEAWAWKGLAHAERALKVKPGDPRALELRGTLQYRLSQQAADSATAANLLDAAERDLRAAVSSNPSQATAWSTLSQLLHLARAQFAEAKQAALRAYEEDAFVADAYDILRQLCQTSVDLKQYEDAHRWCGEGRRRFPGRLRFVAGELVALTVAPVQQAHVEKAWALRNEIAQLSPEHRRPFFVPVAEMQVAAVLARVGLVDSARAVVRRAREGATDEQLRFCAYEEAYARLLVGEREQALRALELYLEDNPQKRTYIAEDPWFETLRDDPRFRHLVAPST